MGALVRNQLATIEDLEKLKEEILAGFTEILTAAPTGPNRKKWLKSSEACELLGFSSGKLQVLRQQKAISISRIGGNVYYDRDELLALFEKNKYQKKKSI